MEPMELNELRVGQKVLVKDTSKRDVANQLHVLWVGYDASGDQKAPVVVVGPDPDMARVLVDGDTVQRDGENVLADDLERNQRIEIEGEPFIVRCVRGGTADQGYEQVVAVMPQAPAMELYEILTATDASRVFLPTPE